NTECIDMGNSLHWDFVFFCGDYAVENYLCYWRAGSLRASGSEMVWFVHSTVPSVWHQSAQGLQMSGSVPPSRAAGFAQLLAPAQTFAPANGRTLAAGVASTAPPPSPLGSKENSRLLAEIGRASCRERVWMWARAGA